MNEMTLFDNERWFTTKEICAMCNVKSIQTFTNFKDELTIPTDWIRYEMRGLRKNIKTTLYSESVLKEFQAWLMKNQANQGRSSEVVKAETENAVKQDIAITTIIQSGNIEAMKCLMEHYVAETQAVAEVQAQKRLIETLQPKAAVYDKIANATGLLSVEEVGKKLGYGKITFYKLLREMQIFHYVTNGYGERINLPYQYYEDSGYFQVKEETYQYGDETRAYSRIFFTGKGEMWITNKIQTTEKWGTK